MVNFFIQGVRFCIRYFQRRNVFYFVLPILVFYSCASPESNEELIANKVNITFDNKSFSIKNDFIGSNENCNGIFVRAQNQTSTDDYFTIDFRLTKLGALEKIMLATKSSGSIFSSADFNPTALITINNFIYDESKKYLYFEFEGELIREDSFYATIDQDKERKPIKGIVTVKDVKNTNCTSIINDMNFQTTNLKFYTNTANSSYETTILTNPYTFNFYSDNGFRTVIKSKVDLSNLEKGTYHFDRTSLENRIDFDQYIGNFRATGLLWIREIDWKKYQTSGSYSILEHLIINGQKVTKGEINLQIFDNGVLKYNVSRAKFEVRGF